MPAEVFAPITLLLLGYHLRREASDVGEKERPVHPIPKEDLAVALAVFF